MADYKIQIGTQLDTSGIETGINKYHQKKAIEFKSKLDTTGIDQKISNYKTKKSIEVNSKLNTSGISQKIREFKPKTPISINTKLNNKGLTDGIRNFKTKASITVNAKLNNSNITTAIKNYKSKTSIQIGTKLDKAGLNRQISEYQSPAIKVNAKLNKKDINDVIKNYKATNIKLNAKLNKGDINEQIRTFKPKSTIYLNAKLKKGEIAEEIRNYKPSTPIRVDLDLGYDNVNAIIDTIKPTSKVKVGVKLDGKDINTQITKLTKPTEKIDVGVSLDESKINADIALFKPTATLGIQPDLIIENVDDQIRAYVPKSQIKVDVKIDDIIDDNITKKDIQPPIQVNVKLDRENINEQIKNFKTSSKIKVGVKLDFASHKDGDKEIQKGISKQIKDYETNAKIKVGVQLDSDDISQQIASIRTDTPIRLNVELDKDSIQNIKSQIGNIRKQIQDLGNININLGGNAGARFGSGGSGGISGNNVGGVGNSRNIVNNISEITTTANNAEHTIQRLRQTLASAKFDNASINLVTQHLEQMNLAITNVTSRIRDNNLRLNIKGIDDVGRTVTVLKEINLASGEITNIGKNISQSFGRSREEIKRTNEAYREMKSLIKEITNVSIDINSAVAAGKSFDALERKLSALNARYDELEVNFAGGFDANQVRNISNEWAKVAHDVNIANEAISNTRAELARGVKNDISNGNLQNSINNVVQKFNKLGIANQQVTNDIERLQSLLNNMDASDDIESVTNDYQEFLHLLQYVDNGVNALKIQMDELNRPESLSISRESAMQRLNGLFEEGSQASKRFGAAAEELRNELNMAGNAQSIELVNRKIKNLGTEVKNSGLQVKTFGSRLKDQLSKYSQYLSVASIFMYATQAARSMFEQVKLIDSAMTELRKVTDETNASYNNFLSNAATRAKEIGTTIDGLVSSTADFARLGYGFEDAQGLAEVANIYAVVGDEVEGVEGATESLISTMAAFKDEMNGVNNADFAMGIIDIFNELGKLIA